MLFNVRAVFLSSLVQFLIDTNGNFFFFSILWYVRKYVAKQNKLILFINNRITVQYSVKILGVMGILKLFVLDIQYKIKIPNDQLQYNNSNK